MNWKAIEATTVQDDQNKWDRKANARQFRITETGVIELSNGEKGSGKYSLSDLATSQMCQKLKIPVDYYRRLPGDMKAVVANHDLARMNGNPYLLRGKGEWIRAFLSGGYVAYNNSQITETVQDLLQGANVRVKTFVLEESHMFLKIISEDIKDTGSGLKAGVMIGNSEVGQGSVSVEPFVFRLACTNDLVVAQEKSFRHAHIHFTVSELNHRMANGISHAFHFANEALERFLKTHAEPVLNPVLTIKLLAAKRKLSLKFTDEIVSSYNSEPEPSRFGIINAFTGAAQKLAPLQRIEIERYAGTLLAGKW